MEVEDNQKEKKKKKRKCGSKYQRRVF